MNCPKCGIPLHEIPEHVTKGKGWRCENDKCDFYQKERYDLNDIESSDED